MRVAALECHLMRVASLECRRCERMRVAALECHLEAPRETKSVFLSYPSGGLVPLSVVQICLPALRRERAHSGVSSKKKSSGWSGFSVTLFTLGLPFFLSCCKIKSLSSLNELIPGVRQRARETELAREKDTVVS